MKQPKLTLGHHLLLPFRQLILDGHPVRLGNKALQILSTLAVAKGQLVTIDDLMNTIWSGLFVENNAVQVHVAALRILDFSWNAPDKATEIAISGEAVAQQVAE